MAVTSALESHLPNKRGLTIDEAATYCGVHRATIYRVVRDGKLTIRKIAGRSIILKDDLDALLEGSTAPTQNREAA